MIATERWGKSQATDGPSIFSHVNFPKRLFGGAVGYEAFSLWTIAVDALEADAVKCWLTLVVKLGVE